MDKQSQEKIDLARSFLERGYHLQMTGYLDRALRFYKRSIEFHPTPKAYTYLGWAYSLKGDYKQAIEQCRIAITLNPDFGSAYNDIGAYYLQQKLYDKARSWLEKALNASDYENYCYPYYNLGLLNEAKGHWSKALQYYRLALSERPDYEPAQTAFDKLTGKFN